MARSYAGRLKAPKDQARWSPMEDFVLDQLVGKVSYRLIALRLGRTPGAVQRRASYKGLSQRQNWRSDKKTRSAQLDKVNAERLTMTAEELAAYL